MKKNKFIKAIILVIFTISMNVYSITNEKIVLDDMGSFTFGGKVYEKENGDTFHGDHGYA